MVLEHLSLQNFRNYENVSVGFSPDVNLIYGLNAQGKTNFLESIYLLCLGRSFRLAKNQDLVQKGKDFFLLEGSFQLDNGLRKTVILNYIRDRRKEISVDKKKLRGHSEIFGSFPVVVMAPDEFKITSGGPSERRRFLDILLSQVSLSYLANLQEYSRTLKQRNKILQSIRDGLDGGAEVLEPWTEKLIRAGSRITRRRAEFLQEFSQVLTDIYTNFSKSKDVLRVRLESKIGNAGLAELEKNYAAELQKYFPRETALGTTLVGPHRDDVLFEINGMDLRKFGSRGEHKSVLLCVKIAEFQYIRERRSETPLLLLDDCYSELDEFREQRVFENVQNLGQIYLTTPKLNPVLESRLLPAGAGNSKHFYIESGTIVEKKDTIHS